MKKRWIGLLLSLIFSIFGWCYTMKKDWGKLVIGLVLIIMLSDFIGSTAGTIIYIAAILDHVVMPDRYYSSY